MSHRLLFRGGLVVDERGTWEEDLLVEEGRVVERGSVRAHAPVVDCSGLWVLPGAVDPHVHFCLESAGIRTADDVFWGTRSAIAGGVTTVADFVPPVCSGLREAWHRFASLWSDAACDWTAHVTLTSSSRVLVDELEEMAARGITTSVKVYTTYRSRGLFIDDDALLALLEETRRGFVVLVHAESDALVRRLEERRPPGASALQVAGAHPPEAEEEACARVAAFASCVGGRAHLVHVSSPQSLRVVSGFRERGALVSTETCPHYLLLSKEVLEGPQGHRFLTFPPVRDAGAREGLWSAVGGGMVDVIATDSCGFAARDKDAFAHTPWEVPAGIPGVEVSLRLMVSHGVRAGRIGPSDVVRLMSANPARLLGLYPTKGALEVGSDADIVLLDPGDCGTLHIDELVSQAGYSPYQGFSALAPPRQVYLRGRLAAQRGRWVEGGPRGEMLRRGSPSLPCERRTAA